MSEIKESSLSAEEHDQRAAKEAVKLMRSIKQAEQNGKPGSVPGSEVRLEMDALIPEDDRLYNFDTHVDWRRPGLQLEDSIKFQALSIVYHNLGFPLLNVRPYSVVGALKEPVKNGEREGVRDIRWFLRSPTDPNIQLITTDRQKPQGQGRREMTRVLYYKKSPRDSELVEAER